MATHRHIHIAIIITGHTEITLKPPNYLFTWKDLLVKQLKVDKPGIDSGFWNKEGRTEDPESQRRGCPITIQCIRRLSVASPRRSATGPRSQRPRRAGVGRWFENASGR